MDKLKTFDEFLCFYREQRLSIIPIPYGKKEANIKWQLYQKRLPTDEEMEKWFGNKQSNLAIVCGEVSGNLVVLDCDSNEKFLGLKPIIESRLGIDNLINHTPIVKTGNGYHIYFRTPTPVKSTKFPRLDVKGEGGYVISPPSVHPNGTQYQFVNPNVPDIFVINSLADIGIDLDQKPEVPRNQPNWVSEALKGVAQGLRNETCFRLAGYFKNHLSQDVTQQLLIDWNSKNKPPLNEKEVLTVIDSAYGYPIADNNSVSNCISPDDLVLKRTKNAQKTHNFGVEDIREFVRSQGFRYWEVRNLDYELGIASPEEKHYRRRLLSYLEEKLEIEKHPTDGKKFRQISQNDVINYKAVALGKPLDLWLPFDIHKHFNVYPGSLLDFAGVTDSGKTALSVNIIKNNDDKWAIDYWTNELSPEELNERLQNIEPDKYIGDWNFTAKAIQPGYLQKIRPNILNIFDYLDVGDPFYRIAEEQQAIHDAIGKGVAIIFLQKDESRILGRGKAFSAQLPRLYISMDMKTAYAYKAKTPKNPNNPLKGKTCDFKLRNGVHFEFSEWRYKSD